MSIMIVIEVQFHYEYMELMRWLNEWFVISEGLKLMRWLNEYNDRD